MTSKDDSDLFRAYVVSDEAWYAQHLLPGDQGEIMVQMASTGGGAKWEFGIRRVDGVGFRLEMFADSWVAFTDVPDLFAALAALNEEKPSEQQIRKVLDDHGFQDHTERGAPPGTTPPQRLLTVTRKQERELVAAAQAAENATRRDSNDAEIEALREAYESAFAALGITIPEGAEPCDYCEGSQGEHETDDCPGIEDD